MNPCPAVVPKVQVALRALSVTAVLQVLLWDWNCQPCSIIQAMLGNTNASQLVLRPWWPPRTRTLTRQTRHFFRAASMLPGRTRAVPCSATDARRSSIQPWGHLYYQAYCINLDRRPERWRFMQDQFNRLRMPVLRWPAVDGAGLNVPHLAELGIVAKEALPRYFLPEEQKLFGTDLTAGGIGCALSHMMIWRDIIAKCTARETEPRDQFLVIEDDCFFDDQFSESLLAERLSHVPEDWEIVFLGGQDLLRRQHEYQVGQGVRRLYKGFRETTAYVINMAGAKTALEVCIPMYWQVDTHLNDESLRDGLRPPRPGETDFTMRPKGYCLWPPLVAQHRERFSTDVQKVEHD